MFFWNVGTSLSDYMTSHHKWVQFHMPNITAERWRQMRCRVKDCSWSRYQFMHSSSLLVVSTSWWTFRDYVVNIVEAQFETVSCEHIVTHSSWLCCKHCWCAVRDCYLWAHHDGPFVTMLQTSVVAQSVTVSCEHIMTHSSWLCCKYLLMHSPWLLVVSISWGNFRDYVTNICWCTVRDCELWAHHDAQFVTMLQISVDAQSVTVTSTSWRTVRDYVTNIVDAPFVTVTWEYIMTDISWLCCKHLLMHSPWLLVVSTSWRTVRDYAANICWCKVRDC